jgi:hypothetical protein
MVLKESAIYTFELLNAIGSVRRSSSRLGQSEKPLGCSIRHQGEEITLPLEDSASDRKKTD